MRTIISSNKYDINKYIIRNKNIDKIKHFIYWIFYTKDIEVSFLCDIIFIVKITKEQFELHFVV